MLKENLGYNYQLRVNLQQARRERDGNSYGSGNVGDNVENRKVRWSRNLPRVSLISRRNKIFLIIYFSVSLSALLYVIYFTAFSGTMKQTSKLKMEAIYRRVHQYNETLTHAEVCRQMMCHNYDRERLLHRSLITIVTAYFNLGSFMKGSWNEYTTQTYWHWIGAYSKVLNNVLFYTDDYAFARRLLDERTYPHQRTCVCLLDRDSLWSFSLVPRIKKIISGRGYPKHSPNTVLPEYGAAMHAKYELMNMAIAENVFETRYFAWSDVGVYRSLVDTQQFSRVRSFELILPPGFNQKRVAYTQVERPDFQRSMDEYFTENLVWVCGCFFIGERTVMQRWTVEYRRFVDLFLRIGWSSTDQQVIYAMFSRLFVYSNERPRTRLQEYIPRDDKSAFRWFYLALLCRHEGLKLRDALARIPKRQRKGQAGTSLLSNKSSTFIDTDMEMREDTEDSRIRDDGTSFDVQSSPKSGDNQEKDVSLGTRSLYFEY